MISPLTALTTVSEVIKFKKTLDELLLEISPGCRSDTVRRLQSLSSAMKGVVGSIQYDLTESHFGRSEAQIMSFEALYIASATDDVIDETELRLEEQVAVIKELLNTIKTGKPTNLGIGQLDMLSILAIDLNARISRSKDPYWFFEEYEILAEAAMQQVYGNTSPELTAKIGGGTMAISAVIPYCFDTNIDKRFLTAAKLFGGYFQILDDIMDFRHDKDKRIHTVITDSKNPAEAIKKMKKIATELYRQSMLHLQPREHAVYTTLDLLMRTKWFADKYLFRK